MMSVNLGRYKPEAISCPLSRLGLLLFALSLSGYSSVAQGQIVATAGNLFAGGSDPDLAIDGDTNGDFNLGSVFHSAGTDSNEWWQLDLGSVQYIEDLTIYNRTHPCCETRLSYTHVFISDTDFSSAGASGVDNASFLSAEATATFESDLGNVVENDFAPKTVSVGATGRYIRLQKSGVNNANGGNVAADALHFAELEYRLQVDYGDAADTYSDASHFVSSDLYIGTTQGDIELDTQLGGDAGVGADGDDGDGTDDENGVTLAALNTSDTDYSLTVTVENSSGTSATLFGWIDLDGNTTFDEDERVSVSVPSPTSGAVDLDWTGLSPSAGTSYVRLRLTSEDLVTGETADAGAQDDISFGSAYDGEVEDYGLSITDDAEVYFEAECGIAGSTWAANFATAASESVYFEPVLTRTDATLAGAQTQSTLLEYQVPVPVIGTYDLYVLYENPSTTDQDDSFFYSIDNSTWATINNTPTGVSGYNWVNLETYTAGGTYQEITTTSVNQVVTIYITYREDGIRLDKFALLADDSAVPLGQGSDVGSCFDFGDAPDTAFNTTGTGDYITSILNAVPGPIHPVDSSPAVYLGNVAPDTEADALDNVTATGDDASDEGEAQLASTAASDVFPPLASSDTSYSVEIDVTNNKAVDATVVAWIDFNSNGLFEAGEQAGTNPAVLASAGSTQVTLSWTGLTGLTLGTTVARFRVSTDTELVTKGSIDVVIDGEVEDHQLNIIPLADFSDGPAEYPTVYHLQSTDITLGSLIDYETAVFTTADADGDDLDTTDDEDGVTQYLNIVAESQFYTVELSCNDHNGALDQGATVYGWIDFDGDDSLGNDPAEFTSAVCSDPDNVTEGSATLTFSGFNSLFTGSNDDVLARFRITTDTLTSTDAATNASDGEVEDYIANVINEGNFGSCPSAGFLIQQGTPDLNEIDIAGGTSVLLESNMLYEDGSSAVATNGWGYNEFDNYIYGVIQDNSQTLLRLGERAGGVYGITRFGPFPDLPTFSVTWGDVDSNGVLHMGRSGQSELHRVDVNPASPTYLTHLGTVTIDTPAGLPGDMSFNPLDGLMYGLSGGGNIVQLNTATGVRINLANFGTVPGFVGESIANAGAGFFDGVGFFYGSINATGRIYRFDLRDPTAMAAADGTSALADYVDYFGQPTGNTSVNDGARCASALIEVDYGDAPTAAQSGFAENYPTLLDDDGARHNITDSNTLYLGSVAGDNEYNGQPAVNADEDDTTDSVDEDGVSFDALIIDTTPEVTVVASSAGTLNAWMDFNLDGDWLDADEQIITDTAVAAGTNVIVITVPASISLGTTYARFRVSSDTGLAPTGPASDGEVEDYEVTLVSPNDFGDAPSIYGDAAHEISVSQNLYLGPAVPDVENGSQQGGDAGVGADGDDGDGNDDESSVITVPILSSNLIGQTYSLDVIVVNSSDDASADLFGWIDFDGNNVFDTDEGVTLNTPNSGIYQLDWVVPGDLSIADSYIRLRLTTDAGVTTATPASLASDGEVEDYSLIVTDPLDYGDAIDSALGTATLDYRTELADDGARHLLSADLFLGDTLADADGDAFDNGAATGDEINGAADEGSEQLLAAAQGVEFPDLAVADASFDFDIDLTNTTGVGANLFVWIDYDQNGSFDEDELASGAPISVSNLSTSASISSVPAADAIVGNTFMRLRLTSDVAVVAGSNGGEDEASFGLANNGEVEDYRINVTGLDFGDAPDSYATDKTDGGEGVGPSHVQLGTLYIGDSLPDLDSDGLPSAGASGDDGDGDDEGGFFIPVIGTSDTSYSISLPVLNNTGNDATLIGWLDYNEDGAFDVGEAVSTTVTSGTTSATLTGWTFAALSGSQTYLRLRLTTDAAITSATPGGAASNGEVEDHLVVIGALDFGDAPDTYSTDSIAGNDGAGGFDGIGPSHGTISSLYIGTTVPDGEADGQASSTATGDDIAGTVDEAPFIFSLPTPASESYSLSVTVVNTTGVDAELVGWIDFDGNGFFDDDESATVTVPDLTVSADLVWGNIPGDISVGDTFIRLRLTSDASVATGDATTSSPKGPATDGEVEDHIISIATAYDYGDAPDSYGTDTADGGEGFGPRHIISPLLYLGSFAPDAELDGQVSADALLDDDTGTGSATTTDSTDGDEGDLFIATIQPNQTSYSLSVPLTNSTGASATLYGWLDLNQDGDFDDTNESQTTTVLPGSSFGTLVFTWTSGNTSGGNGLDNGNTFLRLRLSSESGLGPTETLVTDFADDGEVEDYRVQVSQLTCDLLYGVYNNGGFTRLREFNADTVDLPSMPTTVESAGIGIDRIYRRLYYTQRNNGTENSLYYYDPNLATPNRDTGGDLPAGGNDNYNRMAFSYDGRGVVVESSDYDVHLFDPTATGVGQTVTGAVSLTNEAAILGNGGDLAFDRDDNLYMVTYTNGGGAEFYLYEIRFFDTGDDPLVDAPTEIPDLVLTGSPQTAYFAFAFLLLTEDNASGEDIAGMAFNFDNLIYLQGDSGATFTWDVGITASGGTGAVQTLALGSGSADLASCIYPYIRAIIEPVKTVVNTTSGGVGYVPGDILEYTIVVRNAGGFPSFDTIFQDDIQPSTTYLPNSATMNGDALTDTGGLMPFVVGREIHTDGSADGTVLADITPGVIGDNEVVITYSVRVDSDGSNAEICNQGFIDYQANLSSPIPTNDPGTGTVDDPTCLSQTSGFKVSGTLYEDANVDGIQSASEPGIGGVAMVLYDSVASSCESVLTNANGFYEFPSVSSGPKTVYELSGAAVPSPATCPPAALGNDPSGFLSSTTNSTSIYVVNTDITDLDFGDVRLPSLTPDLESVVEPGGIQTYSHIFRAPTNGAVSFAALSTSSPVLAGWTSTIYQDLDCSGDLTSSDFIVISDISMVAGESICLLNRVFAPTQAIAGNTLSTELTATFDYDGALIGDQDVEAQDLTTVLDDGESALQLTKRVRNITDTSSEFDVVAGISNAAKPGDRLRYEISFANTGVGDISDVDIYDSIPAYTELAEVLALDCTYTGPAGAPLTAIVPPAVMDSCSLITPSGGANAIGYGGTLHWQLSGVLQPGEEGLIVFTVDVD